MSNRVRIAISAGHALLSVARATIMALKHVDDKRPAPIPPVRPASVPTPTPIPAPPAKPELVLVPDSPPESAEVRAYLVMMIDTRPVAHERPGIALCRVGVGTFSEPTPTTGGNAHTVVLANAVSETYEKACEALREYAQKHQPWASALLGAARS